MNRIELVIDELVLEGVPARERHAIAAAVERALHERLAADPSLGQRLVAGATDRFDAGALRLAPQPTPAQWGAGIAGALLGAVQGERR